MPFPPALSFQEVQLGPQGAINGDGPVENDSEEPSQAALPAAPPARSNEVAFHAGLNGIGTQLLDNPLDNLNPIASGNLPAPLSGYQYRIETIVLYCTTSVKFTLGNGNGAVWGPFQFAAGSFVIPLGTHPDKSRSGIPLGRNLVPLLSTAQAWTGRLELTGYQVPVA